MASTRWWTAANAISVGRAALGIAVFVYAAATGASGGASAAEASGLVALLVFSIVLDGVDGWVARRRGTDSTLGSYVDVLCDRITEDAGWIFLAAQNSKWGVVIAIVMLRNAAVDGAKAISAFLGHELKIGVLATGWRLAVVRSRWSRVGHNALKTIALAAGLLSAMTSWPAALAVMIVLMVFLILSLARGAASLAELPLTVRAGRVGPPAALWSGFLAQGILTFATLVAVTLVIVL